MIVSDYIDQGGPDTISTTWQQKGGRFTTQSNGAKVSIQLWIQLGSGWVTYDDVSLRPVVTYNLSKACLERSEKMPKTVLQVAPSGQA